jgi:ubiquinone/menaquinone biosynthesis C-methylase UbiE
MPKMTDATRGLLGTDLEGVTLEGEKLDAYRDFWERSARVDAIRAISDQDDDKSFEVSGRTDARALVGLVPPDASALEIGCGTGRVMQHLAGACERLHGIDISEEMVAQGRERLAGLPNVSFHVGNGYDLAPFETDSLDLVYSLYAFQHMPKTTAYNYLAESARVLRPEGLLRFQVPNILRDDHFLAFHHFTQPWFVEHPYPMNYYTPSEILSLLGRAGFRLEDLDDQMLVLARRTDDVTASETIRERVARFEHPRLIGELVERAERSEADAAELGAELDAMRRRKVVRLANLARHPVATLRRRLRRR